MWAGFGGKEGRKQGEMGTAPQSAGIISRLPVAWPRAFPEPVPKVTDSSPEAATFILTAQQRQQQRAPQAPKAETPARSVALP